MKLTFTLLGLLLLGGCAHQPPSEPTQAATETVEKSPFQGHPILGIWTFTENGCSESYQFFSNGTRKGVSGTEIIEAVYNISSKPLPSGAYVLKDKVLSDIGGVGCSGVEADLTGDIVELLVFFGPEKKTLTFCSAVNPEQCFGPLEKEEIPQ